MEFPVPHTRKSSEIQFSGEPDASPSPAAGELEQKLNHRFKRHELLEQALTHSSFAYEHSAADQAQADNERLEYLGDAVVGLIVAESLYHRFPDLREGELTRLRGSLVSRKHLAEVAAKLELGAYLRLGRGERRGRVKATLLANAMEAVIAAVYLDAGLDAARQLIDSQVIGPDIDTLRNQIGAGGSLGDYKSTLQQWLQSRNLRQPEYRTTAETGPEHQKCFQVEARSGGEVLAEGSGPTRKDAEQEAARRALEHLRHVGDAQ